MSITGKRQTSNPDRKVPPRRVTFEESLRDIPRHFANDGDLISSHMAAVLSALFPDGEDFFVRSVRHFRHEISDPALKRQVSGFIGQEALHGRQHRAFNDRLARLGYPVKIIERFVKWGLQLRTRLVPAKANLALTAALEHFTATLAELILTNAEARNMFGHQAVRDLFTWHALEECEHKAVAFDVYKAVGGGERLRVWTMTALRYGFVLGMIVQTGLSLLGDRDTYRPRVFFTSLRRLLHSPVVSRKVWQRLKDYNRPDFHPDDRDTEPLVAHWSAELFGAHGTLSHTVASA